MVVDEARFTTLLNLVTKTFIYFFIYFYLAILG